MRRSYPLHVDRLEDRCVPTADLVTGVTPEMVTMAAPDDGTQFVIDVYLVDPDAPAAPSKPADSNPDGWSQPGESTVPPIGDPFWY